MTFLLLWEQVMDSLIQKQSCYKELLREVTLLLGFLEPLYGTLNATSNVACVVILASKGSKPYFRVGKACVDLLESEESAASNCLQILVITFRLCIPHMARAKCEQCHMLDISMTLALPSDHFAGRGGLEHEREICVHACEGECTTPTDPAYQLVCPFIPPPLKKSRVPRNNPVHPLTAKLIQLPPDFPSLFCKRKPIY